MREVLRPATAQDAVRMVEKGVYMLGGTEVLRLGSSVDVSRPVVDVSAVVPSGISVGSGIVEIGAGTTFADLLGSGLVPDFLKAAASEMKSPQLRNAATVGGNIASKRDDSYLIPALVAASAVLVVMNRKGEIHECPLSEYVFKDCSCLILKVVFKAGEDVKVRRFALTSHSHAVLTCAFGSSECYAVKGGGIALGPDDAVFVSDMYGSAEYKKYLVSVAKTGAGR